MNRAGHSVYSCPTTACEDLEDGCSCHSPNQGVPLSEPDEPADAEGTSPEEGP